MTIGGWAAVIIGWLIVIGSAVFVISFNYDKWWVIVISVVLALAICVGIYAIGRWYFTTTASGIRALTDQRSELSNGIERTVTVYTGTGDVIAQYKGKIDIEMEEDYVKFDWEGKRYIYYNCFVETIADIPN